jgi:hypothetical protein
MSGTPRSKSGNSSRFPAPQLAIHGPLTEEEDDDDKFCTNNHRRKSSHTFRRVQRVSLQVGRATKEKLWNSNEISIKAALTAVDQWEALYNALRLLMIASFKSATGLYGAAKEGVSTLEHGLLMPVRDWVLLPAFGGIEQAVIETGNFLQSDQAKQLAGETLEMAKKVPYVGENLLAPFMCFSVGFLQRSWEIAQYPIPSKEQVRDTVDGALTGTKWALSSVAREIFMYIKRADANITRTISHTQWKLVGSGPYASLDKLAKVEVIDHMCERYFSLSDPFARYELAAHVRAQNKPLYHDLVLTGVLKERGSDLTKDDEWLSTSPVYRELEEAFLIRQPGEHAVMPVDVSALWFRLPFVNGNRPARDTPWVCFCRNEQDILEERYLGLLRDREVGPREPREDNEYENLDSLEEIASRWPTIAKWYSVDLTSDVVVDQKRHAVSFFACCPRCRQTHEAVNPPLVQKQYGDLCNACQIKSDGDNSCLLMPPPLAMVMRPTLWRFHGPGDDVCRASWFLDTPRSGLQPFDDEAASILEDAYLFLKWMSKRQAFETDDTIDGVLLTVEVPCPDGTERLVQFSSLSRATAIQKGIGAAVALFKRQVFRGAWLKEKSNEDRQRERMSTVDESLSNAVRDHGSLGETLVPNMSIRLALSPTKVVAEDRLVLYEDETNSLAVDPDVLEETMGKYLNDHREGKIEHLVLIVHGIGEMLRSIDVFGLSLPNLASIVDCCAYLRKNNLEVQDAQFDEMYPAADEGARAATGRVEYLPVEWHEAFSILSQRSRPSEVDDAGGTLQQKAPHVMLKDITLRTIPNMRDFANDTLMDVLYFMSPEHHDIIVDVVTNEMNVVVDKFRRLTRFDGRISVIGHSLGSIIAWDILANQLPRGMRGVVSDESFDTLSGSYSPALHVDRTTAYSGAPEITSPPASLSDYPPLNFQVDNFFLLGSPVAVFLMIRNQRKPLSDDFYLRGCRRVFNIYHPYDPVAYRIEPCIDPRNADFEATIMKHWNGGFRVQYQTKRLWRKLVESTWKAQHSVVEMFEASMAGMGLVDSAVTDDDVDDEVSTSDTSCDEVTTNRVITGALNQGRRIDYMMQEKEIENANEYVAALAAHSSYWIEKDLSLFVARQIYLSSLEYQAEKEESDNWDYILR